MGWEWRMFYPVQPGQPVFDIWSFLEVNPTAVDPPRADTYFCCTAKAGVKYRNGTLLEVKLQGSRDAATGAERWVKHARQCTWATAAPAASSAPLSSPPAATSLPTPSTTAATDPVGVPDVGTLPAEALQGAAAGGAAAAAAVGALSEAELAAECAGVHAAVQSVHDEVAVNDGDQYLQVLQGALEVLRQHGQASGRLQAVTLYKGERYKAKVKLPGATAGFSIEQTDLQVSPSAGTAAAVRHWRTVCLEAKTLKPLAAVLQQGRVVPGSSIVTLLSVARQLGGQPMGYPEFMLNLASA